MGVGWAAMTLATNECMSNSYSAGVYCAGI